MFSVNTFYLNCPFSECLPWSPEYFKFNSEKTIEKIKILKETIQRFFEEEKDVLNDYAYVYKSRYVFEILKGENNISLDHSSLKEFIINGTLPFDEMKHRDRVKIQNLSKAIDFVFPQIFKPNLPLSRFNEEFAKQIHEIIGKDLFEKPGEYRVSEAMAAVVNYRYVEASTIDSEIKKLFRQTRMMLTKYKGEPEFLIKIASQFLIHFLTIHPFENGNGRLARILVSYILLAITFVPLSIISYSNYDYLKCLIDERTKAPLAPSNLTSLLLESAFFNLEEICKYFNIYPNFEMNI
jgi:Fic family protein